MMDQIDKSLDSQRIKLSEFLLQEKNLIETLANLEKSIQQLLGSIAALEYVKALQSSSDGIKV